MENKVVRSRRVSKGVSEATPSADELADGATLFRAIFERSGGATALFDMQGVLARCNPAFEKLLGSSEQDLQKKEFIHVDDRKLEAELSRELVAGKREKYEIEKRFIASDGRTVWVNDIVSLVKSGDDTPRYSVHVIQDITAHKQAEEQADLLHLITIDVAAASDLPSALEVVLRRICEKTGWELGQAWIPNANGTDLDCCPAWFATTENLAEFRAHSTACSFQRGLGLPGRVWESRQPAWLRDVSQAPNFPRAEIAKRNGLKAGLAVPILSDSEVIAVLEFFLRAPRDEDERLVKLIAAVAAQIGLLVERKRAEEELRRVSERLQVATRAATIGIWDWDVLADELVWDDAMYRIYGRRREDFSGAYDAWASSLAPEDFERATAEVEAALRGEREFETEFRIVWPDGSVHYTKAASQTFRDEAGRPVRMVGVNYDLTERKLAEENLRRERDLSETVINSLPGVFYFFDSHGRYLRWNKNHELVTGYSSDEMAERHPLDFVNDSEKELIEEAIKEAFKTGRATVEANFVGKDGKATPYFFTGDSLIVNGEPCVLGMGIDISDRRRLEEERKKLIQELGKRVKELTALHLTARILQDEKKTIPELLQAIVMILPSAWQYPEITAARISFGEKEFRTVNWAESQWSQLAAFTAGGLNGSIEVSYVESRPSEHKGPFLAEEEKLIHSIAEMLGSTLDRRFAQDALKESERRFSDTLTNIEMIAVMADIHGDITFCNDYLLRLTDWRREEAIGRNWYEMFLPENERQKVAGLLGGIEPAGVVTIHMENEIKTRSGERRLVTWTNTTLRAPNGEVIGLAALGDDITERKKAEQELLASREQLRALSKSLRRAKEEEGIRIAREIHDELGSALTSLKWSLLRFNKLSSAPDQSITVERYSQEIEEMIQLVDATINTVRRIASELRPGVLDDLGLISAIEWHAQQFEENTGIECRIDTLLENADLNQERATSVFRIFQEAMTNILRHAQATKIRVLIEQEPTQFLLEVRDNGRGITDIEKAGKRSLGILGMRERAHGIGGTVSIEGTPGKGTVVVVCVPLEVEYGS